MNSELFWSASTEDLKKGYTHNSQENSFTCLLCGTAYEIGIIYTIDGILYDAEKAAKIHIETQHPPIVDFFLGLGRIYTGLSAGQEEIAKLSCAGHSDKEIVALTGANSPSTVRNQRFAIREKYKQAKILVALVELMEESARNKKNPRQGTANDGSRVKDDDKLIDFHLAATSVDERYAITQAEREDILKRYFGPDNKLLIKGFPAKEKRKIIIMQKIMADFKAERKYSEKEVNALLKQYYDDYVSVRRAMIQYGFLDRNENGTMYWVRLA